ncbi:5-formyltetrahydrofolate cyclo-ligase [Allosphingosinicella vermicomposti]|uniref:5-formyltetrahydrofolate cyclo-ligase n=1 Tax=Allosphingosinicella vermicomposti TaxID=614671 RepID=UPI00131A54A6|nr:5-formyltetrahydrofolate cyclo-ligase [Allosphingosinicella vermicomposti]
MREEALKRRRDYARSLGAEMRNRLEAQLAEHLTDFLTTRTVRAEPVEARSSRLERPSTSSGLAGMGIENEFNSAEVIAGYHPMRDEISPLPLLEALRDHGRITALPWFEDRDARMIFRENPATEVGPWGVLQPSADAPVALPNLVFVPLVLIDRRGTRIGHGKGHYDRALSHLRQSGPVRTIGICWDIQLSDALIPADPWDIPLDAIATPTQWIMTQ